MEPRVSIILPVYNAEKYLSKCLDSILSQEYSDFELIIVDDGSTDDSGTICRRYAAKDSRVRLIRQENSGVSNARNLAIGRAKGVYLQFVDSDDWITPDATRLLVCTADANDCDLVISDFYRVAGERVSHKGDIETDDVLTREEFAKYMMENPADFYYGVLWNKLFRRELVETYHIRMDARIDWCEDFLFNLEYILHAKVFYALQTPIYYYRKRRGSLVSQGMSITQTIRMKLMVFESYNDFFKHVYDEQDYEKKRAQVYRFLIDAANDGGVPPAIFPTAIKLGDERTNVYASSLSGDGVLSEMYRSRKLLYRYLEASSIKYDLTVQESILLLYLRQPHGTLTRAEIADFTGTTVNNVSRSLQKLSRRELIRFEAPKSAPRSTKLLVITLLPAVEPILVELVAAERDFGETRFSDFTKEERIIYEELDQKMDTTIFNILS